MIYGRSSNIAAAAAVSASIGVSYVPSRKITEYRPVEVLCTNFGSPVLFLTWVFCWFTDQVTNLKLPNRLLSLSLSSWSTHIPAGTSPLCIFQIMRCVRNLPYPGTLVFLYWHVLLPQSSANRPRAFLAFFFHSNRPSVRYKNHSFKTSTGGRGLRGTGIDLTPCHYQHRVSYRNTNVNRSAK